MYEVLQGIAYTCISGAFEAWGVSKLKENEEPDKVQTLILRGVQGRRCGTLVGCFISGIMGMSQIGEMILWYIIMNLICLLGAVFLMKEGRRYFF